ncbi:hypothetical protein [Indioceanicola profundi]|uniref:hypothetical protein n=1 Tax=Indioceanicola profundi TaxID=2220096 RepID=UPI000E6ADBED|nr:hypothetical protein [Indioceanicola profundi]
MPLKMIRLELARTEEEFPQGANDRGYEFVAPLTDDGHLDQEGWNSGKDRCTVRRFWAAEPEEHGRLINQGGKWYFHYDGLEAGEDEPIFRFEGHTFIEGEYMSVTEHDGVQRPFKIVSIAPVE